MVPLAYYHRRLALYVYYLVLANGHLESTYIEGNQSVTFRKIRHVNIRRLVLPCKEATHSRRFY
jgi:hypothetical protein